MNAIVKLSRLAAAAGSGTGTAGADPDVLGVTSDSRSVRGGWLFVAVRGYRSDGATYAEEAVRRGAVAVMAASPAPEGWDPGVPWVRVEDDRLALARVSCDYFGHPSRGLKLAGITGTNGKTTTAYLLEAIFREAGIPTGLLGTVVYRWPGGSEEALRTTPESPDINRCLARMRAEGCGAAVLEVSSHALALRRVDGLDFDAALFTNLTRDHLDYHRSLREYFDAKARLFEGLKEEAAAVINLDDPKAPDLLARSRGRKTTYGQNAGADLRIVALQSGPDGLVVRLESPRHGAIEIRSPLLGRMMAWNIGAAALAALECGVDAEAVRRGIESVLLVPGRMQRIEEGQPFPVVVDYAHTDDALRNLLLSLREWKPARLIVVFGCGGDRDQEKRPLMGAVAARHADVAVVTSDNPRSEDPKTIIDQVLAGIEKRPGLDLHVEPDRRAALDLALSLAGPADIVAVAGKGHETYQEVRGLRTHFDDSEVLRDLLRERTVRGSSRGGRSAPPRGPGCPALAL